MTTKQISNAVSQILDTLKSVIQDYQELDHNWPDSFSDTMEEVQAAMKLTRNLMENKALEVLDKVDITLLKKQLDLLMRCVNGKILRKSQRETLSGMENYISELLVALKEGR